MKSREWLFAARPSPRTAGTNIRPHCNPKILWSDVRSVGQCRSSSMDARPRELAARMADEQIFRLPLEAARCRVREIIHQPSKHGRLAVIQNWRQLSDGQIEFVARYFAAAD